MSWNLDKINPYTNIYIYIYIFVLLNEYLTIPLKQSIFISVKYYVQCLNFQMMSCDEYKIIFIKKNHFWTLI